MSEQHQVAEVKRDVSLTASDVPAPAQLGATLKPVGEGERLASLDVLRGFALLGILMMNIQVFSLPVGDFIDPAAAMGEPLSGKIVWALTKVLFEYKFMSLFSLLFGAGFMVQMLRAEARGARHTPVYLRRLAILALFGLAHGFLLWYGDVLLMYAIVGLALLLVRRMSPKLMFATGVSIALTFAYMHLTGATMMMFVEQAQHREALVENTKPAGESVVGGVADEATEEAASAPVDESAHAAGDEAETVPAAAAAPVSADEAVSVPGEGGAAEAAPREWPAFLNAMMEAQWNPMDQRWREAEIEAYSEGPAVDAFGFRAVSYLMVMVLAPFGFAWRALAMFLCGAALLRFGFFTKAGRSWQIRFALIGLLVGLPLEALHVWFQFKAHHAEVGGGTLMLLASSTHEIGSLAMMFGIAGCGCLIAHAPMWKPIATILANVGRMALTNYIMQTVLATFIMYWWGLGLFGEVSRPRQVALVLAIYAFQLAFSALWLRVFRMGPLEWLWRTLTYLRRPPMLRSSTPTPHGN
jgi:uncharacterized protein